jgi:nitrate reductase delta subunit
MGIFALLAEAFCYPHPKLREELAAGLAAAGKTPGRDGLAAFVKKVGALSLADWEELATSTLDLSPAAAPYVGFQVWGESYQRGEFMAKLNRAMAELDIDPAGELPDHLVPILRYLDVAEQPLAELNEHLKTALGRMIGILREGDKGNPYIVLLEATLAAVQSQRARTYAA